MNHLHYNALKAYSYLTDHYKYKQIQQLKKSNGEYSLKTFLATKSLFVHVPKAAGISVTKALYGNFGGGHTTLNQYTYAFSKSEMDSFFKFTFVRNPWDRLYSAYSFLKRGGMNMADNEWAMNNLNKYQNFEEFIMNWLTPTTVSSYIHFYPQTHFIASNQHKKLKLDFIGRFESIEDDFKYVAGKIGVEATLEHSNKTERESASYIDMYTGEMKKKVEKIYESDIKLLDYTFS